MWRKYTNVLPGGNDGICHFIGDLLFFASCFYPTYKEICQRKKQVKKQS